jgi:hypothetical protein
MTNDQFILTFREDDLRAIYRDSFDYKLFLKDNYSILILIILFLVLSIITSIKTIQSGNYFFLLLCFFSAFSYQVIKLLKNYWQFKKRIIEIESWLEINKKYLTHHIKFGESFFKYTRDNDIFTIDLKNIIKTFRTDDYLYLETLDNGNIVIPRNSFEKGEYEKFILAFDSCRQ